MQQDVGTARERAVGIADRPPSLVPVGKLAHSLLDRWPLLPSRNGVGVQLHKHAFAREADERQDFPQAMKLDDRRDSVGVARATP